MDKLNVKSLCLILPRRELWPGFSTYTCWQTLLMATKRVSQDHATLSDIYNNQLVNRYNDLVDDTSRVYKKVRPIKNEKKTAGIYSEYRVVTSCPASVTWLWQGVNNIYIFIMSQNRSLVAAIAILIWFYQSHGCDVRDMTWPILPG